MGNNTSYEQTGGNPVGTSAHLQETIEKLLKRQNNTEIKFDKHDISSAQSDFDLDSIREVRQVAGSFDKLKVVPRRSRYAGEGSMYDSKNIEQSNIIEKSYVDPKNKKHIVLSATSTDSEQTGGNPFQLYTPENGAKIQQSSMSDSDFKMLRDVILKSGKGNTNTNNVNCIAKIQSGGCACAGEGTLDNNTSPQPISYNHLLKGGADKSEEDDEDESELEDSDDIDSEGEEDEDDDDDDDSDEDEETPVSASELEKNGASSSASSDDKQSRQTKKSSNKNHKQKRVSSEQSEGSAEVRIDAKYLYSSDNNSSYGSDLSDYYKTYKHKSFLH
jgi:galactitol-specific phosphotransferase system IIB component